MLPSGNDAALCLAEGIGAILCSEKGLNTSETPPDQIYISQMSKYAEELGLSHSHFRNPTGLDYHGNFSTAHEINLIATAAMRFGVFKTIVRSQEHYFSLKGANGLKRNVRWVNTNKLLNVGFDGLKTGVTPAAGPCLTASLHSQAGYIIVTVLHCKSLEDRWSEVQSLATWAQSIFICR
jgi:D-alanyl-D-alanine carboxypeptidase